MKVTQCKGEGQGSCKRCTNNGKWNRMWMCFLYNIEGLEGCYCKNCVKEIQEEKPECPECKHFVGCEPSTLGVCDQFEKDGEE
jgi:hypothetical protein